MPFLPILISLLYLLFSPPPAHAKVVINEISPYTSPDWVELFNISNEDIDLIQYSLQDNTQSGNTKTFSCSLAPQGYLLVEWSNKLNKSGDTIFLKKEDEIIDCVAYGNVGQEICPEKETVDIASLEEGQFAARTEENEWEVKSDNTKDAPNDGSPKLEGAICSTPTPSPTPSPSPSPTSTPTPSPSPTPTPTPSSEPSLTSSPSLSPSPFSLKNSPLATIAGVADISEINLSSFSLKASPSPSSSPSESSHQSSPFFSRKPVFFFASGTIFSLAGLLHYLKKNKQSNV